MTRFSGQELALLCVVDANGNLRPVPISAAGVIQTSGIAAEGSLVNLSGQQIIIPYGVDANGNLVPFSVDANGVLQVSGGSGGFVNPMSAPNDLIIGGAAGVATKLVKGSDGQVLTVDPITHNLIWSTPSAGSGALTKIDEHVTGVGGEASYTFSNIPGTYSSLRLIASARNSANAVNVALGIRFNGDSAANYYQHGSTEGVGSPTGYAAAGQTSTLIGNIPAATAEASRFGSYIIDIPFYAKTTFYKNLHVISEKVYGAPSPYSEYLAGGGLWSNTAAITSITIVPASGNLIEGSCFTLYGIS